jgi:hypothetical protein
MIDIIILPVNAKVLREIHQGITRLARLPWLVI